MDENFTHLQSFIQGIIKEAVETALNQKNQNSAKKKPEEPEQSNSGEILNVDQAAEFLHLAKQTLYTLTCKRRIPFYKNGKKILFKKIELQEWMDSGRKSQQDETPSQDRRPIRNRRQR
ncbi:MAG: helix-turn-helix domain-containing protein [Bacteroidales bacterium]|nr:helix-turn-helix domain-containing protein [Bacteroidales bacterium]MCF8458920.1 helix-turn-helix domain-containing protein [Bacteroidales bacterium]